MKINFGYTPDTDDAFHYYALENGRLETMQDEEFAFRRLPIQELNQLALEGVLEVSAVSSMIYPKIEGRYVILSAGSSVGRGYGPLLGVKEGSSLRDLRGKKVGVPGPLTTGYFLLNYFYDGFEPVVMHHDRIAGAIASGEIDAGVLIHEELLNYRFHGVQKLACLGDSWFGETGLPLPVGLSVARRDLGAAKIRRIKDLLAGSMRYAMAHRDEAMAFASGFSTGRGEVTAEFVAKFANQDTENMPADVRKGLSELYRRASLKGFISHEPSLEIV